MPVSPSVVGACILGHAHVHRDPVSTLALIGVLVLTFAVVVFLYDALLGRSRRQQAVEDDRIEVVEDVLAPNRPDFDAPFRDPGE